MTTTERILDKVNGPADVKQLTIEEMTLLADEMRQMILQKDSAVGGHVGPT